MSAYDPLGTPWRSRLGSALLVACLSVLAACAPPPPPFNATEVKGIDYGRGLGITDTAAFLKSRQAQAGKATQTAVALAHNNTISQLKA